MRLTDYFKSHARKVYRRLKAGAEDKILAEAAAWIRRQGGSASHRDVYTYKVVGCQTRAAAEELFKNLQDAGWGQTETSRPTRGGPTSVVFRLHSANEGR